jgi:hypothetical protein
MPGFTRSNRTAFAVFGFILLNCAFIQRVGQPPTPTPTSTSTATDTPTPRWQMGDDLVGTRWTLVYDAPQDGHQEYDIIFHEGGRLETFHPNDRTPDNDTWKLVGSKITLCMNDCFAMYTGEFLDADTMAGTAENDNHESWAWTAYRKIA